MRWKHVNKPRLILLVTLLFTAFGAGVFRTPPILFMAATLCGAPFIGLLVSRIASRGLKISRQIPDAGMVGDVIRLRLTLKNEGFCPAFLVCALGFLDLEAPQKLRWPRMGSRSKKLARQSNSVLVEGVMEAVGEPNLMVPVLFPRAHVVGELRWKLLRRGVYALSGAAAGALDPIGLYSHFPARDRPGELVIMPRPLRLQRLELTGGGQGAQMPLGVASAAEAADLHGVRPHRPGEGLRRVHWKATARTGALHVVEWEEETASDIVILLDTQAGLIAGDKEEDTLEMSVVAAATVAAYCLENSQRVQIFWYENDGEKCRLAFSQARHRAALSDVLTALARVRPCENEGATLAALAQEARKNCPGFESALFLGNERADFLSAWHYWGEVGRGKALAFTSDAFSDARGQDGAVPGEFQEEKEPRTLSEKIASINPATKPRFRASKTDTLFAPTAGNLPSGQLLPARTVRVGRRDSIPSALERLI